MITLTDLTEKSNLSRQSYITRLNDLVVGKDYNIIPLFLNDGKNLNTEKNLLK